MIRFAVIGRNFVADWMIEASHQVDDLELIGVYSRKLETATEYARKHGAKKVYTSLDTLCTDDDIDMVYVASPNALHEEQSIRLLRSGKHVLCEKPIAPNMESLHRMQNAAKESGCVLMEAMMPAHLPALQKIKALLPQMGKIRRATLQYCQYSSRYDKFKNGIIENAFDPTLCNGALMDIGVYCINMMVWLFGRPESIVGSTTFLPQSIDGQGTIVASYPEHLVELIYSKITQGIQVSQIQGEDACLLIDSMPRPRHLTLIKRTGERTEIDCSDAFSDMYYELTDFVRMVKGESLSQFMEHTEMQIDVLEQARAAMGIDFTKK